MKFKVGDRVKVKIFEKRPFGWANCGSMDHLMGKVLEVKEVTPMNSLVIYDEKHKRTWCLLSSEVEPVNETIVIYRKDNTVTALNKATGDKAVAKCNPADKFDFMTGAKLAFERLTEISPVSHKKPLYSGKVVCIRSRHDFVLTVGKIYEFKDGALIMNDGIKSSVYESLDDFHKKNPHYEFLEVVE